MARRTKYFYNPKSLSFEKVSDHRSYVLWRRFGATSLFVVLVVGLSFIISHFYVRFNMLPGQQNNFAVLQELETTNRQIDEFEKRLQDLEDKDINIYINSPGGDITALFAIYDTMQFIKNDIATICLGQAASAAAVLLAAGTKGKRLALPHARVLLHQPYGQVGYSQVTDLELAAREILRMRELLEQILSKHTGQTIDRIHVDTDRDFTLEAQAALDYGVIDEIITTRAMTDRSGPIR